MKRKLVLFDIDGTILLTAGAGRRAICAALAEEVKDTSAFEGIRFDGKTDPQIVAEDSSAQAGRVACWMQSTDLVLRGPRCSTPR